MLHINSSVYMYWLSSCTVAWLRYIAIKLRIDVSQLMNASEIFLVASLLYKLCCLLSMNIIMAEPVDTKYVNLMCYCLHVVLSWSPPCMFATV